MAAALQWAQLADQYADNETVDRVYADVYLAGASRNQGDEAAAQRLYRRAVELALRQDDSRALLASSVNVLNATATPPEAHSERITLAEELSKRQLDQVDSVNLTNTLYGLGQAFLTWGRREEAERHWQRAKEAAARSRDAQMAFTPLVIDALMYTLDGRLEAMPEIAAKIRALGIEIGQEGLGRQLGARSTRPAQIYLGRADEALAGLPDPANIFTAGGVFAGQRALCLAHLGRTPEAADILQRMLVARDMGRSDDPTSAAVQRYLLDAAVLLKDAEAARVLAARMAALAGLLHTEADMCYNIGRLLGGAAALLGETEKARGYYVQALEVCEKVRFRPEIALTRLELAELLLEHHPAERAAALEHLEFAIGEFREMKMQPSLERALRHKDVLKA